MRKFIMGFIIGAVIASVATAYAAGAFTLVSGSGVALGTAANPLYIS